MTTFLKATSDSLPLPAATADPYAHYFRDVRYFEKIDVYRVLALFEVTDPCLQHAIKKLLVAGGRGAKDAPKDIAEAIVSLRRWQEMRSEERQMPEQKYDVTRIVGTGQPVGAGG